MIVVKISGKTIDRGWNALSKAAIYFGDPSVKVGLLEGKGSATHGKSGLTVAAIGAIHEYGVPANPALGIQGIPERSWLRGTFDAYIWIYERSFRRIARAFFSGKTNAKDALELIGATFAADIKARIAAGKIPPPNAKSTIARKHNDRTLIDTLQLYDAIDFKFEP